MRATITAHFGLLFALANTSAFAQSTDPQNWYANLTPLAENISGGQCSNRSDVWAFELEKLSGQQPSKAMILYTENFSVNHWRFHIAPVLKIDHKWMVFEKANGVSSVLDLQSWMQTVNNGTVCEEVSTLPIEFQNSFRQIQRTREGKVYRYEKAAEVGSECLLMIVHQDVTSPDRGFLDFTLEDSIPNYPLDYQKAFDACIDNETVKVRTGDAEWMVSPEIAERADRFCKSALNGVR